MCFKISVAQKEDTQSINMCQGVFDSPLDILSPWH